MPNLVSFLIIFLCNVNRHDSESVKEGQCLSVFNRLKFTVLSSLISSMPMKEISLITGSSIVKLRLLCKPFGLSRKVLAVPTSGITILACHLRVFYTGSESCLVNKFKFQIMTECVVL